MACEPPEKSGRPITHWTAHELADEVVKRGIVPSISVAQVGRYLREAALQPHKKRYWLNTTEKDPVQFQKQVEAVCDTYLEAPALEQNQRTHTVSSDEMTGLQALERNAPSRPMTFGQCEKIEFEYTRHGTLTLIGNFQVTTGELIAPTIGPTRTEADFASHIEQTVATDPKASWIFVVDNLNIHCSETLVRKVAQACGIEQPLGKKGVRGVLKSVASRQAFLSEKSQRIRFVYTPKHSSWLNLLDPGLIVLLIGPRARELEMLFLAIALECLVDEGAVIVRVDPADRHRVLTSHDCKPFDDQKLLPGHQRDRLGPPRTHIGRHQAPQEGPLHGVAAVGNEVHLEEPRFRLLPVCEGPDGNLPAGLRSRLALPASTCCPADRR